MTINTKRVQGRRTVSYKSIDDLLQDAEQLASSEVLQLGNWSLGQNLVHLAMTLNGSIDGFDFLLPAPVRWLMTLLMKKKYLQEIPAGFKTAAKYTPEPTSPEAGLEALRAAAARLEKEPKRALHPAFGKLTLEEWNQFHLRHAEMHLSFIVPDNMKE